MSEFTCGRHWLLTWTTYGTWLPGDPRGSVTSVREGDGPRIEHDQPGTPWEDSMPGLFRAAKSEMKGKPIYLETEHAPILLQQFQETATYRQWVLRGVAFMANHIHIVVGVTGDPDPSNLLRDFKSYGSRALSREFGKPANETWWTRRGSQRKLPNDVAVQAALQYLRNQARPLLIWIAE